MSNVRPAMYVRDTRSSSTDVHRSTVEGTRFVLRWIVAFCGASVEARRHSSAVSQTATLVSKRGASLQSSHRKSSSKSAVAQGTKNAREQEVVAGGPPQFRVPGSRTVLRAYAGARPCLLGQRSSTLPAMKRRASEPMAPILNVAGEAAHFGRRSNPSIEGTSNSGLRPLSAAPHVKR